MKGNSLHNVYYGRLGSKNSQGTNGDVRPNFSSFNDFHCSRFLTCTILVIADILGVNNYMEALFPSLSLNSVFKNMQRKTNLKNRHFKVQRKFEFELILKETGNNHQRTNVPKGRLRAMFAV